MNELAKPRIGLREGRTVLRDPNCKSCLLHKGAKTVCVGGRGPLNAKVVLVGEAPGREEDIAGKPFVGKAGKLLTSILDHFGVKEEEVYITNAVRCKPPENRQPSPLEIQACKKYLTHEIERIKPEKIICLGSTALKSVHGSRDTLTKARTRTYQIWGSTVYVTYHPAAVFRNPYWLKLIYEDFANVFGPPKKIQLGTYEKVSPLQAQELFEEVAQEGVVALDIETNGLNCYAQDPKIWTIGLSTKANHAYVIPIHHKEGNNPDPEGTLQALDRYLLRNKNVTIVGHNIKFDLRWLLVFGAKIQARVFDTMIAFHLLDENYPNKGLKHLAQKYVEMPFYDENIQAMRKKRKEFADQQFPLDEMIKYNGADCDATIRLYHFFNKHLEEEGLTKYMSFQMSVLKMLLGMEHAGIKVNKERLYELSKKYEGDLSDVERKIKKRTGDINLSSPAQLSRVLYNQLGFKAPLTTDKGAPSTNSESLDILQRTQKCAVAKDILQYRSITKLLGTYLHGIEGRIAADGLVHTTFQLASNRESDDRGSRGGTVTGRVGSDMQQIPRRGGIKSMFISRFKDGLICQADYSQIELRVLAHYSEDPHMIEAFTTEKVDIHRRVAAKIYRKAEEEVTKEERTRTKTINFGIAYCMGPEALANQLDISKNSAKRFIREWYDNFPAVEKWIKRMELTIIRRGFVTTLFGRKRRLMGATHHSAVGREILRQGINAPIQGTASEITLYATMRLHQYFERMKYRSKIMLNVHDSVVVDVHPNEKAHIPEDIRRIYTNLPLQERFGIQLKVPLEIEVKTGPTWELADA